MKSFVTTILLCAGLTACGSMPLEVNRVTDVNAPLTGVRYAIARPSYDINLRFLSEVSKSKNKCLFTVSVAQNMKGEGLIFEVTSKNRPLSSNNFSVSMDEKGNLSAFSGSETSTAKETIDAVAGLVKATSGAALAIPPFDISQCSATGSEELDEYVLKQVMLEKNFRKLEMGLAGSFTSLPSSGAPSETQILAIAALRREIESQKKTVEQHVFNINDKVKLTIKTGSASDRVISPKQGIKHWFDIELEEML